MTLFTINNPSRAVYKIKGSKFFSYIHFIPSIEEFKEKLNYYRLSNPKAVHVVSAFRIKSEQRIDEFSSDDGEPRGSSGNPTLNSMKKKKLINVGIYIVRYFGGTKLGISGLINAYKYSAEQAIEKSIMIEFVDIAKIKISYHSSLNRIVSSIVSFYSCSIANRKFDGENILIVINVVESKAQQFINQIVEKTAGKVEIDV